MCKLNPILLGIDACSDPFNRDGRVSGVPTLPPSRSEISMGFYQDDILEHLQSPARHPHALVSAGVDDTTDIGMPMSLAWDMSFNFDIPMPTT